MESRQTSWLRANTNLQVRHPVLTLGLDFLVLDVFAIVAGLSARTTSTGGDVEEDDVAEMLADICRGSDELNREAYFELPTSSSNCVVAPS